MDENKVIAYSFLAHLNNHNIGNGFFDIFIPLVKRTLSKLCNNNQFMGQVTDIKEKFQELYGFDIPYPILREILKSISIQINKSTNGKMVIYSDNAYCIEKYTFDDYEETLVYKKSKIEKLQLEFKNYVKNKAIISQYEDELDIFKFIDRNKTRLSTFLSSDMNNMEEINKNADIEMEFIKHISNTDIELYNTLKEIYIGSIISTYIEIDKINSQNEKMKFIVDTNFVISLLGLHSEESKDTCEKTINICKKLGYKIIISDYTIDETEHILTKIIEETDNGILGRYRYNSTQYICEKKHITKTDLILKQRKLNEFIAENGISIIYLKNKYKNQNIVRNGQAYKKLEEINYVNNESRLHDAILLDYVSNERNKNAKTFSDMKVWFLTESKKLTTIKLKYKYSEAITTSELVNLLWLMKPIISSEDIFKLGLSNLFAEVIEMRQPNKKIIREIDDNIKKYKGNINDDDIVSLGMIISNSSIDLLKNMNKDYEEINKALANGEFNEFSNKIKLMKEEQEKNREEQDRIKEQQRQMELQEIQQKHVEEKNEECKNFITVLIKNKVKEIYEENNELEYECREIDNKIDKNIKNVKKMINFFFTSIGLIIGAILIIYKNASEKEFTIDIIDIILLVVPVCFARILNFIILKFTNLIKKLINRKKYFEIERIKNIIYSNDNKIIILDEIQEELMKSTNVKESIEKLSKETRYCDVIQQIQLLEYVNKEEVKIQ